LIELGFDWLTADEAIGLVTVDAIRLFQAIVNGMPACLIITIQFSARLIGTLILLIGTLILMLQRLKTNGARPKKNARLILRKNGARGRCPTICRSGSN